MYEAILYCLAVRGSISVIGTLAQASRNGQAPSSPHLHQSVTALGFSPASDWAPTVLYVSPATELRQTCIRFTTPKHTWPPIVALPDLACNITYDSCALIAVIMVLNDVTTLQNNNKQQWYFVKQLLDCPLTSTHLVFSWDL